MKKSKHWNTLCNILDGQFPKGKSKERGNAMVMVAYIEMMLDGIKFDEEGRPIVKEGKATRHCTYCLTENGDNADEMCAKYRK